MTDPTTPSPARTAVVTGGARGIGAAVARRLAADGLAVAVLDLDEGSCAAVVEEITAAGGGPSPSERMSRRSPPSRLPWPVSRRSSAPRRCS